VAWNVVWFGLRMSNCQVLCIRITTSSNTDVVGGFCMGREDVDQYLYDLKYLKVSEDVFSDLDLYAVFMSMTLQEHRYS
jgi:hypothetical protein